MIQGYRMAGPPPHGDRPDAPHDGEREWPVWLGFLALFGAILVQFVLQVIVLVATGKDTLDDVPEGATLALQACATLVFIGAALLAAAIIKPLSAGQFGLRRTKPLRALGWSVAAMVVFYVTLALYATLVTSPEQTTAKELGADESQLALVIVGFLVVVLSPIAEEIFFRGLFYGALRTRLNVFWAAVIGGVIFGILHASTGVDAIPPLVILGILLCLIYEKTGSLYPCIAVHAFNNTIAYISQTDIQPAVAAGMGGAVILGCLIVPRFAWRSA